MRQYIETCVRALSGHQGKFSEAFERFWFDVQKKYSACNQPMMPQDHIPMWYTRAMDEGIAVAFREPDPVLQAPPPPMDMRTKEGRAQKATLTGV